MRYKKAKRFLAVVLSTTILGQMQEIAYADVYKYENGKLEKIIYDDDSYVEFTYDKNGNTLSRDYHFSDTGQAVVEDSYIMMIKIRDGASNELYLKYPENVKQYFIYRKTAENDTFQLIGRTSEKTFQDENVQSQGCYIYQVKPVYAEETEPGAQASKEVKVRFISPVNNLSFSIESSLGNEIIMGVNDQLTSVSLTWDLQEPGIVYEVKERTKSNTKVYKTEENSFANSNLKKANFAYQVRACVKEGEETLYSSYTNEIAFPVQIPEDIENIWSGRNEAGMQSVFWQVADDSCNFMIYQALDEDGPYHFYSAKMNTDVHSCICKEGFYYRVVSYKVVNGKLVFGNISDAVQV